MCYFLIIIKIIIWKYDNYENVVDLRTIRNKTIVFTLYNLKYTIILHLWKN